MWLGIYYISGYWHSKLYPFLYENSEASISNGCTCHHFSCVKSDNVRKENEGDGVKKRKHVFFFFVDKKEYYTKTFGSLLSLLSSSCVTAPSQ